MSFLTFLGLRQAKSNRTQLTLLDVLHRTLVSGLAGLTVYGLFLGYAVHQETLAKGRGMHFASDNNDVSSNDGMKLMATREAEANALAQAKAAEEAKEVALAEAAQAALHKS